MPTSGSKPSIVFFGSGPVAEASLRALIDSFAIEAVITKPATVENMVGLGVPHSSVHAASDRQELDELVAAQNFYSQLGVIVDYGVIVSKRVIDAFSRGIVNAHFSLLPRWRGADPISFAILEGDAKTGVSLMLIEPTLDTGKLLVQKSLAVEPEDTTPSLTRKLIMLSNNLLVGYLPRYLAGKLTPRQQPHPDRATYSRKLTKEDGLIDWSRPAVLLEREIRAYSGWPGSHTTLAGKEAIITKARVTKASGRPGEASASSGQLLVYCGQDALLIERLKPAGKREMTGPEFIRGYIR